MKKLWVTEKVLIGILIIVPILVFLSTGRAYADRWAKAYGGGQSDQAYSVQQTSDGGFIVAGVKTRLVVATEETAIDAWFLKLDTNGVVEWEKTYGGAVDEEVNYVAHSVQQTSDGGYIVAGETDSSGSSDVWLLKLNPNGTLGWQNTYGDIRADRAYSVQQTSDGGFIVAGETNSFGAGESDFWVLKLNKNGNVGSGFLGTWQKTYGGHLDDRAYSIQQTSDGGYIVAGEKTDDSVSAGTNILDAWVLKLNKNGSVNWEKTYHVNEIDRVYSIDQTTDNGYVVAGMTGTVNQSTLDVWVLKLDVSGSIGASGTWQKTYGGSDIDIARSIQQTSGGYIVAGETSSFGAGSADTWVMKLNADGTVARQKTYGGTEFDAARSVQQTSDGGFIVAGETASFSAGASDFWVLKLNKDGEIPDCEHMATSDATPADTSAAIADTDALILSTSVSNKKGIASPADSEAIVDPACSYEEPDLVVSFFNAPISVSKGVAFKVTDITKNIGSAGAGATTTKFYLSNDTILDGSDTLLGSRSVPALGAGESSPLETDPPTPPATTFVTIPSGKPLGNYYIIAKADAPDDVIESVENNNTNFKAITIAKLTLLVPNGGEVMPSGGNWAICWQAPIIAKKFKLEYSTDDGESWSEIKTVTGLNCTGWDVPVVAGNMKMCRVQVTGYDSADVQVGKDMSNKPFTIEVVRLTSPNGGETLHPGNTWYIRWLTNRTTAPVAQTVLEYTVNNGSVWKPIETLSGNPGIYKWNLPNEDSTNCKVRVTLKKAGETKIGTDVSNKVFKILPLP